MKLDKVSRSVKIFVWLPFAIYSGWVAVASVANVSAYLFNVAWHGVRIRPSTWTIVMIIIAVAINIMVIWRRNMFEFGFVGGWALYAIGVANSGINDTVSSAAFIAAGLLVLSSFANWVRPEQFDYLKERLKK